jgi:hypothetical protein
MAYTTIDDPSVYFQTTLYTGSGSSTQNVVNGGNSDLQPDWVWVKNRTDARWHRLVDSSRGVSKNLYSNEDDAEGTEASVTAFNSDGFSLGTDTGSDGWNEDGDAHVAWQWKANGGTTTSFTESGNNPGGTIQTNTTAGFSIITTTGTGATGTIAHGLGAVPEIIISKQRSNAENWAVYHGSNTSAPETEILTLNTTDATADNANGYNDTAPTSSVNLQCILKTRLIQMQELMCIMFLHPYKATVNLVFILGTEMQMGHLFTQDLNLLFLLLKEQMQVEKILF